MEKNTEKSEKKTTESGDNFIGKLFWGALLVLIGGILLISNFGLVEVDWSDLFRLWPLLIIAAGLSILSINNFIWRLISLVIAILVLGVVAWVLLVGTPDVKILNNQQETIAIESNEVKSFEIGIQAGAGKINVGTSAQADLAVANLESDVMALAKTNKIEQNKQIINFATETKINDWWPNSVKNNLDVNLNRSLPLALKIQVGAADVEVDVSQAILESLNIKLGASSLDVKIGEKQELSDVYIESGASSIKLRLPKNSGIRLKLESGLSSKNIGNMTEVESGIFESVNYKDAKNKINIIVKIGVASFNIESY